MPEKEFTRKPYETLRKRLEEWRRFIQVLAGPRQSGKTTLARQVAASLRSPVLSISADDPGARGRVWLEQQWEFARYQARNAGKSSPVLIVDEIQKVPAWRNSPQPSIRRECCWWDQAGLLLRNSWRVRLPDGWHEP